MKLETRNSPIEFELRGQDGPTGTVVVGYAAVFNSLSHDLGGFRERLAPSSFNKALGGEHHALYNHDSSMVLGRSLANTLRLSTDSQGLRFEIDIPPTSFGDDLIVSMERKDISGASFGFTIASGGDTWSRGDDGMAIRTITEVGQLFEVSITPMPAYPSTSVAIARMRDFQAQDDALHRHIEAERRARIMRLSCV